MSVEGILLFLGEIQIITKGMNQLFFSLQIRRKNIHYKNENLSYAIYTYSDYFAFGNGHDIRINDQCKTSTNNYITIINESKKICYNIEDEEYIFKKSKIYNKNINDKIKDLSKILSNLNV